MNRVPWVAPPLLPLEGGEPGVRDPSSTCVRPGKSVGTPSVLNAVAKPSEIRTTAWAKEGVLPPEAPLTAARALVTLDGTLPSLFNNVVTHCWAINGNLEEPLNCEPAVETFKPSSGVPMTRILLFTVRFVVPVAEMKA